jgi:hypothetical protein
MHYLCQHVGCGQTIQVACAGSYDSKIMATTMAFKPSQWLLYNKMVHVAY